MHKIAVFGGTGMTGQCAVNHALEKGLQVKMLVRDEATVPESFKGKVELVKGNVTNLDDVKKTVENTDAVTVILGTRNSVAPTTEMSTGMKNITIAMNEHKIKTVSVCLSAFLFYEPAKVPKVFIDLNADHQRMFDIVKASDLDYRAILPPHISGEQSAPFQVAYDMSPGRAISKIDLGKFLIDCLGQSEHSRKTIGLANVKPPA